MPTNQWRRVAIQGNPGSYAQAAALNLCPQAEILFFPTFEAAMQATTQDTSLDGAVIPIENSTMGRIADIHALLPFTQLQIVAEHYLPVAHCLLARPGATLASLKTVHSQWPALAQCTENIKQLGLHAIQTADTAGAAKWVAEGADLSCAAIASALAGKLYGLQVLKSPFNDTPDNTTRFVAFSRESLTPEPTTASKTSLLVTLKNQPGALYHALGCLAEQGVNISKIESYLWGPANQAAFYFEVLGHPAATPLATALKALKAKVAAIRTLGVYPAAL